MIEVVVERCGSAETERDVEQRIVILFELLRSTQDGIK